MKHGISYLPEDRKHDGIIGDLSVKDNIILALQVMRGMFRPISKADAAKYADEYIKLLEIKTASPDTPIKSLSGGNQQKVILARWLLANPVYLILDEPTRGIDVGTKLEIQKLVLKLAAEGKSVTFISSEIDEMLNVCSRLIVMRDRKTAGELTGSDLNQSKIMETIAGGEKAHEKRLKRQVETKSSLFLKERSKPDIHSVGGTADTGAVQPDCRPLVLCDKICSEQCR